MYRAYRDPHASARTFFSPNIHTHAWADRDPHAGTDIGRDPYAYPYTHRDAYPSATAHADHQTRATRARVREPVGAKGDSRESARFDSVPRASGWI